MERIVALALLIANVQLVMASCPTETLNACRGTFTTCVTAAGGSQDALCACSANYAFSLLDNACINIQDYQAIIDDCASSGCTMQQCLNGTLPMDSPISMPNAFSPDATCNATFAISCSTAFQSCVGNSVAENLCNCYGPYIFCTYDSGCITEDELQRLVQINCEQQLGCSAEQCNSATNSPLSPPIDPPVSDTPVSPCNSLAAIACADSFNSCNWAAQTSAEVCACYGPYYNCLFDIGCLDIDQYWSEVGSCEQTGCSLEECTGNGTVTSPVSSIPLGVPPTSAPFAPPTSIICLEPWELVLIIVGSMLAGIGLAAIVGVIIYFSRRSSTKKSTKYAKLQRY